MRKIRLPNSFLAEAAEMLKQNRTVTLHIDGQSMYPFIRGGVDIVEIEPFPPGKELPLWSCPIFRWEDRYMIHRYVEKENDEYLMMGDGNITRIERVQRQDILGLLRYIYRPDKSRLDCREKRWLNYGKWWYHLRFARRWMIPLLRILRIR